jgi:hypothetical protein
MPVAAARSNYKNACLVSNFDEEINIKTKDNEQIPITHSIILAGSFAFSQNYVDLLKVSASTTQNNTFDSSDVKTRINNLLVDLTVPIKINEGFSVLTYTHVLIFFFFTRNKGKQHKNI